MVFLVSGGHCLLAVVKDVDEFYLLGNELDDAPGEALDKVSKHSNNSCYEIDHVILN